ncbi:Mating-type protein ALPHA3 [Frankliniella fusca]|uniref:Mating-type protein ALPHA3 n=1 Tax=Frankliniella fusca TaxID=407009 RepID=A0AAE1HHH8_9NEOP|nr:Mating-type protein ALPHA3 [Frankliniella fusca]
MTTPGNISREVMQIVNSNCVPQVVRAPNSNVYLQSSNGGTPVMQVSRVPLTSIGVSFNSSRSNGTPRPSMNQLPCKTLTEADSNGYLKPIKTFKVHQATATITKPFAIIATGGNLNGNPDKENVVAAPSSPFKTTKRKMSLTLKTNCPVLQGKSDPVLLSSQLKARNTLNEFNDKKTSHSLGPKLSFNYEETPRKILNEHNNSDCSTSDLDDSSPSEVDAVLNEESAESDDSDFICRKRSKKISKAKVVVHQSCSDISHPLLLNILPEGYKYQQENLDEVDSTKFIATIRVNIETKEEALKWIKDHETVALTNFRKMNGKENSPRLVYKKRFRCHNNTRASEANSKTKVHHKKHVNCPAVIILTVKNKNMLRSKDKFLQEYPTSVYIKHVHNHRIECADAMRFRRPDDDMKEFFIRLFHRGHSASSALTSLKLDLQEKYGHDYYKVVADGAKCPNIQWVYNIYYNHFSQVYGAPNGEDMLKSLIDFTNEYNSAQKSRCAAVEVFHEQIITVLVTPLMKRVLTHLKSSGEMMFMDSGGCMDRHNSRVFLLLAPSVAGGLPVGLFILSSESEDCIKRAFDIYKEIIPENSFAGRGPSVGPKIIMTDDSTAERNALSYAFTAAVLLLCLFHTLQAFWRYIWENKHNVPKEERPHVMNMFKRCTWASTPEEFQTLFDEMLRVSHVKCNLTLTKHLKDLRCRADEWALCFRRELLVRGHHTDNLTEANIRILKDKILNRTKAFSITQLFDFMSTKLDAYFERRISEVITNRVSNYTSSRYFIDKKKLTPLSCERIAEDFYLVKNSEKGTSYVVDTEVELCSCIAGIGGALCKHLYKVITTFNISSTQVLPFADAQAKLDLHFIMVGVQGDKEFFQNLKFDEGRVQEGGVGQGDKGRIEDTNAHNPESISLENLIAPENSTVQDDVSSNSLDSQDATPSENLEKLVPYLVERCQKNPALTKHVDKFVDRLLKESSTDSALEHALATFNRYRGQKPVKENQIRALSRVRNAGNIPVLSTARRMMPITGRHSRITGRPPKDFRMDHQYSQRAPEPGWKNPPLGRHKAPQNLSHCVTMNVPLGRNCNKKM